MLKTEGLGALSNRQKVYETVARARFPLERMLKTDGLGELLEDEVGKRCTRLKRELGFNLK